MRTYRTIELVLVLGLAGCTRQGPTQPAAQAPGPASAAPAAPAATPAAPGSEAPLAPISVTAPSGGNGVELDAIAPPGFVRRSMDVHPARSEAHLVFAQEGLASTIHLTVRVHESSAAAQAFVTDTRKTVSGALVAAGDLGDGLGLAGVDAQGRPGYALLVRGDVTCVARVVGTLDDSGAVALSSVVGAWRAAVDSAASSPVTARPGILSVAPVAMPRPGNGTLLNVALDPAAPAPYATYAASNGASVVVTTNGPMLYAAKAGVVKVTVAVATSRLLAASGEFEVEIGP